MADPQQPIFKGSIIELTLDQVRFPNGTETQLEIVHHPGGAAVVALDEAHRVCLLRQYRHAAGGWLWELPAGKLDPGEEPFATARRELTEEAGVKAGSWQQLGTTISSPGVCTEVIHLYLARDLAELEPMHEEHELIEIHWVPFAEAVARAAGGDITDAKTVIGLLRAETLLHGASGAPSAGPAAE